MSILANANTKLIVQGMTGRSGTFYTDQAMNPLNMPMRGMTNKSTILQLLMG